MVLHLAAANSFLHSFLVSFLLLCKCENQTLVNQNLVNNFTSTLSSIFFFFRITVTSKSGALTKSWHSSSRPQPNVCFSDIKFISLSWGFSVVPNEREMSLIILLYVGFVGVRGMWPRELYQEQLIISSCLPMWLSCSQSCHLINHHYHLINDWEKQTPNEFTVTLILDLDFSYSFFHKGSPQQVALHVWTDRLLHWILLDATIKEYVSPPGIH